MRAEVNKIRLTVLIAMLFSALCAGVFRTTPIIFMAALLCGAPFVGFIVGSLSSRSLRISRQLPESGKVGDVVSEKIVISNVSRWPIFLVHARSEEASSGHQALIPLSDQVYDAPILRRHEEGVWQRQWLLQRRGIHAIAPVQAGAIDPLGLYNRLPARSSKSQIVILPRPIKIERLGFLGGSGGSNLIPRHSTIVADASDFHGARPWQPGETIRRAHWKSTARTGQLHVIEWEETPTADLAIFLDTSAQAIVGDERNNTLEISITAAASVANHLLENGCRVQLFYYQQIAKPEKSAPAAPVLQHLAVRSVDGANKLLRALAEIVPVTDASGALPRLVEAGLPAVARNAGVLLLASVRADHAGAIAKIGTRAGLPHNHSLAFDAEPATPPDSNGLQAPRDETGTPSIKVRQQAAQISAGRQHPFIQVIRSEEALAAALEGRA